MPSSTVKKNIYLNAFLGMVNDYIRMGMKRKLLLYHVLGWIIFIGYEVSTIYFVMNVRAPVVDYLMHYLLNAAIFYLNLWLIMRNKKILHIIPLIVLEIAGYMIVNYYLNVALELIGLHITRPTKPLYTFLMASFWRCLYFMGFSAIYGFAVNLLKSAKRMNKMTQETLYNEKKQIVLEKNLLSTQNALLRAQINPHFFFNTLNFIYNSVHKVSPSAGEAVMLLSDITRYSISRGDGNGMVKLTDELVNINDLIILNQIRFNDKLEITFDIKGHYREHKIIPLVLLTLVENVFKYGDLQDKVNPVVIKLYTEGEFVHFSTQNKKLPVNNQQNGEGIGITNAKFRLKDAYPGNFTLRINETEDTFFVDLSINEFALCSVATL